MSLNLSCHACYYLQPSQSFSVIEFLFTACCLVNTYTMGIHSQLECPLLLNRTHIDFPNDPILLQSLRSGHVSSDKDRLDWFGENLQRRVFSGAILGDSNLLAKAMGLQMNMDELIHFQRFLLPWKEMEMGGMMGACLGPHLWR